MRACVMAIAAIGGTALGAIAELARRHALEKGQLGMLCLLAVIVAVHRRGRSVRCWPNSAVANTRLGGKLTGDKLPCALG
jgi:hypothetical protein